MHEPIVIEKGNATCVDWNKYDLTTEQAAHELFEDFTDDDSFPDVIDLSPADFTGMSVEDIIESIREYERFGKSLS
jgi:hypothetical protein